MRTKLVAKLAGALPVPVLKAVSRAQDSNKRTLLSRKGLERLKTYSSSTVSAQIAEFYRSLVKQPIAEQPERVLRQRISDFQPDKRLGHTLELRAGFG